MMDSDVRRATLANLPINPRTIPAMLARTRDVDPVVRKLVYTSVLEPHCTTPASSSSIAEGEVLIETMGPTHPRVFTIEQRELVVRNGLGDREEGVKAAAGKLVSTWLDVVRVGSTSARGSTAARDKENKEKDKESVDVEGDIVAFLELFDLVENSTAEDALTCIFKSRNDILDALKLDGTSSLLLPFPPPPTIKI